MRALMETLVGKDSANSGLPEGDLFRIGGVTGIASGVLGLLANALHPRPGPDDLGDTEVFLELIADTSRWRVVHLAIIVSVMLGLPTFVALSRSVRDLPAAAWSRIALVSALVSGAVAAVSFSIDGFVLAGVADDWSGAAPGARALFLERAETIEYFDIGIFSVAILGLFGVTQLLFGITFWGSAVYPNWMGVTAGVAGIAGLISGVAIWISGGFSVFNFLVLFSLSSVAFVVWLFAGSILLLRRSRTTAPAGPS
jgi:hypothetical protein